MPGWTFIARALIWPVLLPVALIFHWQDSVFLLLVLSLYANFASDIGAWQAKKAEAANKDKK